MQVFTIGYSKRSAPEFFGALRRAGIRRCVDVRVGNTSQLAGFTKRGDLPFFLREICGAEYIAEPLLSPTRDLVDAYRKGRASWQEYERRFLQLLAERRVELELDPRLFDVPTVLLCVENTAEHCHRRLVFQYLADAWGEMLVTHL